MAQNNSSNLLLVPQAWIIRKCFQKHLLSYSSATLKAVHQKSIVNHSCNKVKGVWKALEQSPKKLRWANLSTPLLLTATSTPPPDNCIHEVYYWSKAEVRHSFTLHISLICQSTLFKNSKGTAGFWGSRGLVQSLSLMSTSNCKS